MQHREIITRKLEQLEGKVSRIDSFISRGATRTELQQELSLMKDLLQDVHDYIQREPRSNGEISYTPQK